MKKIQQKVKDNWQEILGVIIGSIVVGLSLWLWDKLIAASFNLGDNHFTDLKNWFVVMALLALVGIACCLWFVVKFILWIIEKFYTMFRKDGVINAKK
jgi:ABC-type Mn2+/Zn2+ transport system permease subunit